jgi:tyrosinase
VIDGGGPSNWALPYWNYSDPTRPHVVKLPPAFRESVLPDGITPNPLFIQQRGPGINTGASLNAGTVSTTVALAETVFADPDGAGIASSFGGGVSGRNHSGQLRGSLENVPHGSVHVGVGGLGGWMSAFNTAGRDPIFWLHHANIDRLWSRWLRTQPHVNPALPQWLNEPFEFGSGAWYTKLAAKDVLDTTKTPLSYRYDDQRPKRVPLPEAVRRRREAIVRRGPPERLGATRREVPLGEGPSHAEIEVAEPRAAGLESFAGGRQPGRVFLVLGNVRGTKLSAGSFDVYLNEPENASARQLSSYKAGTISMFGVLESSERNERHAGEGITVSLDVTDLVRRLRSKPGWDAKRLRVTFVPVPDTAGQVYPGNVKVGSVSLHQG